MIGKILSKKWLTTNTTITDNRNMNDHIHTDECLAVNELNETCCVHLSDDHLKNAIRHTVVSRSSTYTIHTFTDTDDDAIALAHALHPELTRADLYVVYRDTNHDLDDLAPPPGYIRYDV